MHGGRKYDGWEIKSHVKVFWDRHTLLEQKKYSKIPRNGQTKLKMPTSALLNVGIKLLALVSKNNFIYDDWEVIKQVKLHTKVADNELCQLVGTLTELVDDADAGHGHIVIVGRILEAVVISSSTILVNRAWSGLNLGGASRAMRELIFAERCRNVGQVGIRLCLSLQVRGQ